VSEVDHGVDVCPPCAVARGRELLAKGCDVDPSSAEALGRLLWRMADLNARRAKMQRERRAFEADCRALMGMAVALRAQVIPSMPEPARSRARRIVDLAIGAVPSEVWFSSGEAEYPEGSIR
jgi:hypothetical protein